MILVFFVIAAEDSLLYADSLHAQPVPDTAGADSIAVVQAIETGTGTDTTKADTITIYEIPDVVQIRGQSSICSPFFVLQSIEPLSYCYTATDLFFTTPFFLVKNRNSVQLASRGFEPLLTQLRVNNHPVNNYLSGYIDLNAIPIFSFSKLDILRNVGADLQNVNMTSKVNKYDRPFSQLNFTTLGHNTIYNVDFTRALTNDLGLYFVGLYSSIYKSQDDLYHKLASYYTNFYYDQFLPLRFDFLYAAGDYENIENNELIDLSGTVALGQNKVTIYFNNYRMALSDTLSDTLGVQSRNTMKNYGLVTETTINSSFLDLYLGFDGSMTRVQTDHEGSFDRRNGAVCVGISKSWRRFLFCVQNRTMYSNDSLFLPAPGFVMGYDIFDSTFITVSLTRGYREPTISETDAPIDTTVYVPNPDLKPESWWNKEVGLKRGNLSIIVYDTDFDDYIITSAEPPYWPPYRQRQNRGERSFMGTEGVLDLGLGSFSGIRLAGNYLFSGEPDYYLPSLNLGSSITLKHESTRSMQAIMVQGQYIGERAAPYGSGFPDAGVVSVIGMVRFITLTATLRMENILDKDVPYAPVPGFNTSLSLKWEFWD